VKSRVPAYPLLRRGEDTPVVDAILRQGTAALLDAPHLYLYVVHGSNSFPSEHFEAHWHRAVARYEGPSYDKRLGELLAPLSIEAHA
jgi:hypothetical protein